MGYQLIFTRFAAAGNLSETLYPEKSTCDFHGPVPGARAKTAPCLCCREFALCSLNCHLTGPMVFGWGPDGGTGDVRPRKQPDQNTGTVLPGNRIAAAGSAENTAAIVEMLFDDFQDHPFLLFGRGT